MVKIILCALVGNFVLILGQLFIPVVRDLFKKSPFFLLPFATFFLLGAILILLTIKKKVKGKLKKFLLLTGVSSSGFFISVLLHNFLLGALNAIFFIVAIFICPIGFLVGIVGSLLFINKKRSSN